MSSVRLDMAKLEAIIAKAPGRAEELVKGGAHAVEGFAGALAPVDTGALKNSIHSARVGALAWQVRDGVEYGIYQELGTSRFAAQPFMVPGVERARADYQKGWVRLFEGL